MPLKALLDGQPILAPLLNDREWAELYVQRHRLVLACCPTVPVQLRGGAGTQRVQHFSHTPLPTCQFRGETTAHLRAKVTMAQACAQAGWSVDIEHGEGDWRADVLAERARQRVAFEVQWSRQTLAQTLARQSRYRLAGVRGCWFCRYPPSELRRGDGGELAARHDLPLFALEAEQGREAYRVRIGGRSYSLGEVVCALLGRRIAYRTHRTFAGAHTLDLMFYARSCPRCSQRWTLYGLAPEQRTAPRSPCGARVLLWTAALAHPDVAQAARRAFEADRALSELPLARVVPGAGFRCPACRTPLVSSRPAGISPDLPVRLTSVSVNVIRPLSDPVPHWCYPPDGALCQEMAPHLGARKAAPRDMEHAGKVPPREYNHRR